MEAWEEGGVRRGRGLGSRSGPDGARRAIEAAALEVVGPAGDEPTRRDLITAEILHGKGLLRELVCALARIDLAAECHACGEPLVTLEAAISHFRAGGPEACDAPATWHELELLGQVPVRYDEALTLAVSLLVSPSAT